MQRKPASPSRKRHQQPLSQFSIDGLIDELTRRGVYVALALCADDVLCLMPWLTRVQAEAIAKSVAYDQPDELVPMAIEVAAQDLGYPFVEPKATNRH